MSTIRMKILFISLLLSTAVLPMMRASEMGGVSGPGVTERSGLGSSEEINQMLEKIRYANHTEEKKFSPWCRHYKGYFNILERVSEDKEGDPKNEEIRNLCLHGLRIRQGLGFNDGVDLVLPDEPEQKKRMEDFRRLAASSMVRASRMSGFGSTKETFEDIEESSKWKDNPNSTWSKNYKGYYDILERVPKDEEGDPKNEEIRNLCLHGLRIREGLGFNHGVDPVLHADWNRRPSLPHQIFDEPVQKKVMEDFIRLIELGADVNSVTYHQKWSLLMSAARNNILKLKGVEFLLKNNIEVDLKDFEGMTALMWAAWDSSNDSHLKVIDLLLQNKADPNSKRNEGETVYMVADREGTRNPEVVKLLLDYGAVPNSKSDKDEEV